MLKNLFQKIGLILLVILMLLLDVFLRNLETKINEKNLEISFFNVDQGDAIFIKAPNGNKILIDGGANNLVIQELSKIMPFYDRNIDLVIGTHADFDHMGGLIDVFDRYQVTRFGHSGKGDNGDEPDSEFYDVLFEKAHQEILEENILTRNQKIILDQDNQVELLILWPAENFSSSDNNENSIVIKLIYKNFSVLLTGDLPDDQEKILIDLDDKILRANILKAGHHGSQTSTANEFLEKVNPEKVIISSGIDNRYGHPNKEVIDRIKKFGAEIFYTKDGTITFISNGEGFYLMTPAFFKVL